MEFLTIREAAAKSRVGKSIKVGESILRRMALAGELAGAEKRGRDWLIPAATVARLRRRRPGRPPKP